MTAGWESYIETHMIILEKWGILEPAQYNQTKVLSDFLSLLDIYLDDKN